MSVRALCCASRCFLTIVIILSVWNRLQIISMTSSLISSKICSWLALLTIIRTKRTMQDETTMVSNRFQNPMNYLVPCSLIRQMKSTKIRIFKVTSAIMKKGFSSMSNPLTRVMTTSKIDAKISRR